MHCSSLGEFEQGRPVFESIRKQFPQHHLVLSFFSPSGYEIRKNYALADQVIYLPLDTPKHARKLIATMRPKLVIWVKYEYWFNTLMELNRQAIPVMLISAKFNQHQPFFQWYGRFWRTQLDCFNTLFVQDEDSVHWLKTIGKHTHALISGDTRFDRVLSIRDNFRNHPAMLAFTHQAPVLVAGSIWPSDLKLIQAFTIAFPNYKCILVPHEVDEHSINQCLNLFPDAVLYSDWIKDTNQHADAMVMLVDQIGLLADLYSLASLCYVGGGFNRSGIHNTLEAAVWGKPVFFGPNYLKFREAVALIECGGGFSIANEESWMDIIQKIESISGEWIRVGKCSEDLVRKHAGATKRIMHQIAEKRLLTN